MHGASRLSYSTNSWQLLHDTCCTTRQAAALSCLPCMQVGCTQAQLLDWQLPAQTQPAASGNCTKISGLFPRAAGTGCGATQHLLYVAVGQIGDQAGQTRPCLPARHQLHICQGRRRHRNGKVAIFGQLQDVDHQLNKGVEVIGLLPRILLSVGACAISRTCNNRAWLGEGPPSKTASASWHRPLGG